MERKALTSWNDPAWAQSSSGLATSVLTLAPAQVLDDWTEAGRAFNFGSSGGMMVLSWSWNILRKVETNKLLFVANFMRWMNKVADIFGRKQNHLNRSVVSVADPNACMHQEHLHLRWLEWGLCKSMVTQVEMLLGRSWAERDTRITYCLHVSPSLTVADLGVFLY